MDLAKPVRIVDILDARIKQDAKGLKIIRPDYGLRSKVKGEVARGCDDALRVFFDGLLGDATVTITYDDTPFGSEVTLTTGNLNVRGDTGGKLHEIRSRVSGKMTVDYPGFKGYRLRLTIPAYSLT